MRCRRTSWSRAARSRKIWAASCVVTWRRSRDSSTGYKTRCRSRQLQISQRQRRRPPNSNSNSNSSRARTVMMRRCTKSWTTFERSWKTRNASRRTITAILLGITHVYSYKTEKYGYMSILFLNILFSFLTTRFARLILVVKHDWKFFVRADATYLIIHCA